MKINQNNDITIYRGESAALDFKISQRSDYYVPFLVSSARVEPMVCITIGSTRRENKNIVSKQLWLDIDTLPKFVQTVVQDLGILSTLSESQLVVNIENGILYQYQRETEVAANINKLHFVYLEGLSTIKSDYNFTVVLTLDETVSLDMTNVDYFYQIELMDTEPIVEHLFGLLNTNPDLVDKLPTAFELNLDGVAAYLTECINVVNTKWPDYWGYRIKDPYTSPVAKVSNIQMLQPPRKFTVQSVVK